MHLARAVGRDQALAEGVTIAGSVGGGLQTASVVGRHTREQLAAFLDQELRQVWATDRESGAPVFLAVGQAQAVRTLAKIRWRCPVPECEDDRITTVGTPRRRDHFRHLGASGGHSDGEGVFHLQAKAMLAAWLAERYPEARVREEQSIKTADSRAARRADVVSTWAGGRRLALEVEYKAFSPEAFNAKDSEYREADVRCVWLFGHLRRHLAQPKRPAGTPVELVDDRLLLRNTTRAAAAAGHVLLFVNPVERSVATAVIEGWPTAGRPGHWMDTKQRFGLRYPDGTEESWEEIHLRVDPLDACTADPQLGLITPTMLAVQASRTEIDRLAAQDRQRLRAKTAAAERAEQQRQAQEHAANCRREQRRQWLENRRAEQEQTWLDSDLRAKVIAREGQVPSELAVSLRDSFGVFAHEEYWHCALYGDLVLGGGVGSSFRVGDCYRSLTRHGIDFNQKDPAKPAEAIIAFLEHLEQCGVLQIEYEQSSTWRIRLVTIVQDLRAAAQAREARKQEQDRAEAARLLARRQQQTQIERRLRLLAEKNRQRYGTNPTALAGMTATATCTVCQQPLDRQMEALGIHPCC